jgi:tetratricopeptide (TPR) repeat protein
MIYCQRCKKANPNEADHCEACGALLLVISRTPDTLPGESIDNSLEEHLLERISTLESALARSNERFEQLLEIAQQQATGSFYDHMMLSSLSELLTDSGLIDADDLEQRWTVRVARHYQETADRERIEERCDRAIAAYRGQYRDDFAWLLTEGVRHLLEGGVKRGLKMLTDALALDDRNVELQFILGEYYFLQGKPLEAGRLLDRAIADQPDHFGAHLLRGLISGDAGDEVEARHHLEEALAVDGKSFAAHFGLGQLLVREGKTAEAIPHLKRALALNPAPEMHYLLGRAYEQTGQRDLALKHLKKAVRLDPHFDIAQYSLGFLYWQSERVAEAREHLHAAYELNPRETRYQRALQATAGDPLPVPPAPGWVNLFPARRPRSRTKTDDARFHDLLWRDLKLMTITPRRAR